MSLKQDLLDTIAYGIKKSLDTEKISLSREFVASVVEVKTGNVCIVEYGGDKYTIKNKNTLNLQPYDIVHIIYPNNDKTKKYMLEDVIATTISKYIV